jgi:cysteine desulfurase/selenocysteine lyase
MRTVRRGFLSALGGVATWPLVAMQQAGEWRVGDWRARIPALSQEVSGHRLAYLDNAATTLRPREVIDALVRFYERDNANPSASLHALARRAAAAQDAARSTVARFLNAATPRDVIFTRGTTEAVNLLAATWGAQEVRAGDEIVVTIAEHASNLFPWQRLASEARARLRVVDVDDDGRLRLDQLAALLNSRTRLVAVTHVSNVLGIVNPVAEICALAQRHGAAVFVDAAQSAPHMRLDVRKLGCDFLAFSSHKLLGPMGVGVLWGREARLAGMPSYHVGSNMAHGLDLATATPEPGGLRFQAGTPNVADAVGLAAAIDLLETIGFETLEAQDAALAADALSRLRAVPGLRVLGNVGPPGRVPVITFTLPGVDVPTIVGAADAAGIALRGGDLAARPLLERFGVAAATRASAYFYNTTAELDRLAEVLNTVRSRARRRRSAPLQV